MATLPLKSSCNEQRAVNCIFMGKRINANQIYSIRCIQYMATSALRSEQFTFGV